MCLEGSVEERKGRSRGGGGIGWDIVVMAGAQGEAERNVGSERRLLRGMYVAHSDMAYPSAILKASWQMVILARRSG